jgi:hypothetical protein
METEFVEFKYTVNSDDSVSITGQTNVKMQFVTVETISEKDTQISALNTELSTKLDEIIRLGEEIKSKDTIISERDTTISELTPYKEKIEASELAQKESELAQKKEDLKVYATKGGYISNEEIETSEEIKKAIDELNMDVIKGIIADRVISSLDKPSEVEVSTVNNKDVTVNLNATNSDNDPLSAFKKFLSE